MSVCVHESAVARVRDPLRLLQVRIHVGFVSAEAGWSLLLLLFCHDLQTHLHLPLDTDPQTTFSHEANH